MIIDVKKCLLLGLVALSEALQAHHGHMTFKRGLPGPVGDDRIPATIRLGNKDWTRSEMSSVIRKALKDPNGSKHFQNRGLEKVGNNWQEKKGPLFSGQGTEGKLVEVDLKENPRVRGPFRAIVTKAGHFVGITEHEVGNNVKSIYDVNQKIARGDFLKVPERIPAGGKQISRAQIAEAMNGKSRTLLREGTDKGSWRAPIKMPAVKGRLPLPSVPGKPADEFFVVFDGNKFVRVEDKNKNSIYPVPQKAGTSRCKRAGADCDWEPSEKESNGAGGSDASSQRPEGTAEGTNEGAGEELSVIIEKASRQEFKELAVRYRLGSVVGKHFHMDLATFRSDKLRYRPFGAARIGASPKLGTKALKSAGTSLKMLGAGLYLHGVIEAFTHQTSAIDRVAAVTAIVPLVGCATSLAASGSHEAIGSFEAVDTFFCVAGDVLLFTPYAPAGLAIHISRFFIGLVRYLASGSSAERLRAATRARDDAWRMFLDEGLYRTLSSDEFGRKLGSVLAVESLAFLSEGAQTIGIFEASRQHSMTLTNDTVEQGQLEDFFQNVTANVRSRLSAEVVARQREVLFELIEKARDQHEQGSARAYAESFNEQFISEKLADDDDEATGQAGSSAPPAAFRDLPATASPDEASKALEALPVDERVHWEQEGLSRREADVISIQQTHAVMQQLDGRMAREAMVKASPTLDAAHAQEVQLLATMMLGSRLRHWGRSDDGKIRFFPASVASDPASTIGSVLGLDVEDVKATLGR
ncbi:hypothetical protein DCS_05922 [Drechmeria coniospora]|uniref:Uncharacterized protein n=1 Tax=Drechmeria coniospora TaxID=98403 RepID=A0A151GA55_DRECN|nr:hypothetical protein DCS_05922 [Drechmeria coniospora]KYK53973.1 hypothetical protein DCS_05922 [Drechmeria coniospora]